MSQFDYTKLPDYTVTHQLAETCSKADDILSHIVSVYEEGRDTIISAYQNLQKEYVDKRLKGADLSHINGGIDVSSLKQKGVSTVYDLLHCKTLEPFNSMPFSSSSALQMRAKILEQSWKDRFHLIIEPHSKDESIERIVAITAQLLAVSPYYNEAKKLYNSIHQKLHISIPLAERNTPQLVWLLHYSSSIRRQIWEAIFEVEEIANSGILEQAENLRKRCNDAIDKSWEQSYWDAFEQNSAPFYAFLESLIGSPKSESSALGFNYCSEAPLQPISGETTTIPQPSSPKPTDLGIPAIPAYSSDPELAELEKKADTLVQSVSKYPLNTSKLSAHLRGYQEFAAKYILHQRQVLLGDEMGLGKTIEAIAAISHLDAAGETHFLVVCPLSVLVNWNRELEKQSRGLNKWVLHGPNAVSQYFYWRRFGGVALTTYDTLKKLQPPDRDIISLLVVDEAHMIKNPRSGRTHTLLEFKKKAKRSLFMTGTPMENKIQEMIFLIRTLRPDIAKLVDAGENKPDATKFRLKIAPVYLRRVREDVLTELPEKEDIEDWCVMNTVEKNAYQHLICTGTQMSIRRVSWNLPDVSYSTKANKLKEICDDAYYNNRKVLVFSFFKDTLRVVQTILGNRAYGPITGDVSNQRRQEIIDRFTNGPKGSVLLCQIIAGGVGLNIQAASVIIFCEPQWKPSLENQAVARAYRMGQSRKVFVHRLLMENTVDEYILAMLQGKAKDFEVFAHLSEAGLASMSELQLMDNIINYEAKRLGVSRSHS